MDKLEEGNSLSVDVIQFKGITDLIIRDGCTIESLVGKLQQYSTTPLCLIDGKIISSIHQAILSSGKLRLERKQQRNDIVEYWFSNIDNGTLYTVFGIENAKLLYPNFREAGPRMRITNAKQDNIVIISDGVRMVFPNPDNQIEIIERSIN